MKNQNFYMRVISVLLVIMAVLFYNSSMKAEENEKEIAALTDKVDTLQNQQSELLSALETIYTSRVQNQTASEADTAAGSDTTDSVSTDSASADNTTDDTTTDSDYVYKDGTQVKLRDTAERSRLR